jgi:hypothetical protein
VRGAEHADKERIERRYAPSEIIDEALSRPEHACRKILSEERAHAGENARDENAKREAQDQHHRVVDRKLRIDKHGQYRADGKQNEVRPTSDPVGEICTDEITDERAAMPRISLGIVDLDQSQSNGAHDWCCDARSRKRVMLLGM